MPFFVFICLLINTGNTDAVTLTGSSDYALPGSDFTLTCDVPEEGNTVQLYRRPDVTIQGSIQVAGGQCYNTFTTPAPCSPDVCSCTATSTNYGTVFRWVIQPQTGDQGSVWFCRRNNPSQADKVVDSPDYTLNVADGPGTSIALSPPDTSYTRTEGDTLPDITCTADCRPGCTFVWTKHDNTNFTTSAVLSLGQLDRSEHGTYRCTARNVVGESTTATSVTVQYGPGTSIALSPPDTTYTRTEGNTLPDITCTADCRPGCTFVWTKPDNTNFTASAVLSLGQLDRSEHGTYRCTARNVVGESTTATSVNILYGPFTVSLTPATTLYTPIEGQTLPTVTCSSDCSPVCTYSWTKDGQSHTTGSDLQLTNIQRGQTGVYRCTASNGYGSPASSDVTVTVNYGPGSSIYFQPRQDVLDRVENQTVHDIVCSADCEPPCTYIWSRTGTTYPNPLSLSTAVRGNAGHYTCTASNSVGQGTKTCNLIVRFPPRIVSLGYTQGNADVPENGSKSLICAVESYPPSTIQWYYKANNTVLLTTPDVQSSTYTLTSADCLDTGVYSCSVRNSVSNTAVTGDIHINVLCQPRQDHRVMHNHSFGLATSETLTIPASFLANPKPTFNWTFQTSSGTNATLLVNGTDNFGIHNTFEKLSAVSVGTRSNIKEAWFGIYNVTATNSQGSGTISFSAVAKGKPDPPKDGKVSCPYQDRAILSWRPAFNGGSTQTFTVGIKIHQQDSFIVDKSLNGLYDPGPLQIINVTVSSLAFDTQHFFMVYAVNDFGNSTLEEEINCTTKAETAPESSPLGSVIGGVVGTLAAVIVVIGIIIIVKRRKSSRKSGEKGKDDNTEMITNRSPEDVSTDGLKANVLYESSGPLPGCSSEYAIVQKPSKTKPVSPNALYSEVDKKGKPDVYAEVVKPKKKAEKGKQKGKRTKKQADDAYKKVNAVAGTEDGVYANCKDDSKPDSNTGSANRKKHGGLVYLDIEFQEDQESGRKCVIHGIENRTDYADIDFTNHVDPSHQTNEKESKPKVDEKSN